MFLCMCNIRRSFKPFPVVVDLKYVRRWHNAKCVAFIGFSRSLMDHVTIRLIMSCTQLLLQREWDGGVDDPPPDCDRSSEVVSESES